jgi:hypothetical protein
MKSENKFYFIYSNSLQIKTSEKKDSASDRNNLEKRYKQQSKAGWSPTLLTVR